MTRRFSCFFLFTALVAAGGLLRAATPNPALIKSTILESNIAYLRVGQVDDNLAAEINAARNTSATTNKIIGAILDLRFADGNDPAAAKAVAAQFAAARLPLAILVNGQTQGAAAALATILREARTGLMLGSATNDLKPDIAVAVDAKDERAYLENPYADMMPDGTNSTAAISSSSPFIDHTSEADLVRAKIKDGEEDEDLQPARPAEPPKPFIHDPALARAVDLLQALAILRPSTR